MKQRLSRSSVPALLLAAGVGICTQTWAYGSQPSRHSAAPRSTATTPATAASTGVKNVFWQPNELRQGSVAFFTVELERAPVRVTATWLDKTLTFFKTDDPKVWYSLSGADLETQPGSYDLHVTAVMANGRSVRTEKKVDIAAADFKTGAIDVPENFVEPDAAGKKQIAQDELLKNRAYAHLLPAPQWSGNFIAPVNAKATDTFGESRILNEEKTSTHRGTDFPVPEGTPVIAANAGTVVPARDMFYEGQCVIVDHGQKFFTIYMHLSKMDVKTGDKLKKGARVGLSGRTGRVTGPHLHMGVRWNGAYLDPTRLLALTLPKVGDGEQTSVTHKARPRR